MEFDVQGVVTGHRAMTKKDKQGKPEYEDYTDADGKKQRRQLINYKILFAWELGVPAVEFWIDQKLAAELVEATGNSFKPGAEFQPYEARAYLRCIVRSTSPEGKTYVNHDLKAVLDDLQPTAAAAAA